MRETSQIGPMRLKKSSDCHAHVARAVSAHSPSSSVHSELYSGGVALGGADSAGDGLADAAMSFVFASSSTFLSSG